MKLLIINCISQLIRLIEIIDFHELIKPDTCKSSLELIAEMFAQPHFRIQTAFFVAQALDKFPQLYPSFRFLIFYFYPSD